MPAEALLAGVTEIARSIATWNAAMLLANDLFEAGRANMEKRAPVLKD